MSEEIIKSYKNTVQSNVKSLLNNFSEIVDVMKSQTENNTEVKLINAEVDCYSIQVKCANMIKSAKTLLELISELKNQFIINSYDKLNSHFGKELSKFNALNSDTLKKLIDIRQRVNSCLKFAEDSYYSSKFRINV
ncbi:Mediator complex subunit 22 [Intoshia linei]|uniref:Mediator of RNA polymerase II transcription subunit 22 n=1 Tax=Intoshia linei TaxID=1819745 RepID=A0A177AUW5_9BILA|nr:Mediator complex subunit 22 [Intoshia linei]